MKNKFLEDINQNNNIKLEKTEDFLKIKVLHTIDETSLIDVLDKLYTFENLVETKPNETRYSVILDLKGLPIPLLAAAIKYSLKREDLVDPVMTLNIINLIKLYNNLDQSFFEDPNIYVCCDEDLIDLKLQIISDLKEFMKKVSIYYISLYKSYNKLEYKIQDIHIKLPNIYNTLFLSLDVMTLSGIFSNSPSFNTNECVYIENAIFYITNLLRKNVLHMDMMNNFLAEQENKKGIENGDKS